MRVTERVEQHIGAFMATLILLLVAAAATWLSYDHGVSSSVILLAYAAALLGAGVGATELISRYKDAPRAVIGGFPGLGYMALNAIASLAAFVIIRLMNWRF